MLTTLVLSFSLLTLPLTSAAAQTSTNRKPTDIQLFLSSYGPHPRPDLIPTYIQLVHTMEAAQKAGARHGVIGFMSEVFLANPAHVREWQQIVPAEDEELKRQLNLAFDISKSGGVLNQPGHSGFLNDEYWGGFFATNDPRFIEKLVDQLPYCDDRDDLDLFLAGMTAKWSLSSVAQTNPAVRFILQNPRHKDSSQIKQHVAELLSASDPSIFKKQMRETIIEQRAVGKWTESRTLR